MWTDKPETQRAAVFANRRRSRSDRGRRLQRQRSERVERSFAHVCETGGARRTWLCGIDKVRKRYLIAAVAHNLGCLMRALFGMGTPRGLQAPVGASSTVWRALQLLQLANWRFRTIVRHVQDHANSFSASAQNHALAAV